MSEQIERSSESDQLNSYSARLDERTMTSLAPLQFTVEERGSLSRGLAVSLLQSLCDVNHGDKMIRLNDARTVAHARTQRRAYDTDAE